MRIVTEDEARALASKGFAVAITIGINFAYRKSMDSQYIVWLMVGPPSVEYNWIGRN